MKNQNPKFDICGLKMPSLPRHEVDLRGVPLQALFLQTPEQKDNEVDTLVLNDLLSSIETLKFIATHVRKEIPN